MAIIYSQLMRTIAEARSEPTWLLSDIHKHIASGELSWRMLNRGIGLRKAYSKSEREKGSHVMADVTEAYKEAAETIEAAKKAYDAVMTSFRATIKNDLASIGASADRVQKEAAKQMHAYRGVIDLMSSENMLLAIQNAERLASALKAISELEQHKITFSVMEKG